MKLLELLNGLFNKLPLNGNKTKAGGAAFVILEIIEKAFPEVALALSPTLQGISLTIFGIGLLHKALKGKFDEK